MMLNRPLSTLALPFLLACCVMLASSDRLPAAQAEPEPAVIVELREALEASPEDAITLRRLGVALARVDKHEEGLEYIQRSIKIAPDDTTTILALGVANSTLGNLDDAIEAYHRVLELEADNAKALNNLGNIFLRRGQQEEAIGWYRKAVTAKPDYIVAYHKLGEVLAYIGRSEEAYAAYEKVLKLRPTSAREHHAFVDSMFSMGKLNVSMKNFDLAERQLAQVLRNVPQHRSAHYARAQALMQLGRMEEAQQELDSHMKILHSTGEGF